MATDPSTIQFSTQTVAGTGSGALGASSASNNFGIQGGGVARGDPVRAPHEWFASTGGMIMPDSKLPEFINKMVEPNLAALKAQQEWDGFVAARAGMTMEELDKDKPWYGNLFGPSNFEIGAQHYNALREVSEMEQDLIERMPELRQMSPQAMAEEFNNMTQSRLTGNQFADALLQKTFMDRAGPLMDMHTKERYAWQQQEQVRLQTAAILTDSKSYSMIARRVVALGKDHPDQPAETEKLLQRQLSLFETLAPSRFQTDDSYKAVVSAVVNGMIEQGDFPTIELMQKHEVFKMMPPDMQNSITATVRQGKQQYRERWMSENPRVADLMAYAGVMQKNGIGGEPMRGILDEMEGLWQAETGITDIPFTPGQVRSNMIEGAWSAHIAAQERALRAEMQAKAAGATEAAKAAAKAEDVRGLQTALEHGTLGIAMALPTAPERAEADAHVTTHWRKIAQQNPQFAMGLLVQNDATEGGFVIKGVQQTFQNRFNHALSPDYNDQLGELYETWKGLKSTSAVRLDENGQPTKGTVQGTATATEYFGTDAHALFTSMQNLERGGLPVQAAYLRAIETIGDKFSGPRGDTAKEQKALNSRVAGVIKQNTGEWRLFGKAFARRLDDGNAMIAADFIRRAQEEMGGLVDDSPEGIQAAAGYAKTRWATEQAGKYFFANDTDNDGQTNPTIGSYVIGKIMREGTGRGTPDDVGDSIERIIDKTLRTQANIPDGEASSVRIYRAGSLGPDVNPVLMISAIDKSGRMKYVQVTGDQVAEEYLRWTKAEREGKNRRPPPGYVWMDDKLVPSIAPQPKL